MYWSDLLPPSHTACPFYDPPLYFIPPLHILAGAQGGGVRVEIEFLRISHGGGGVLNFEPFRGNIWKSILVAWWHKLQVTSPYCICQQLSNWFKSIKGGNSIWIFCNLFLARIGDSSAKDCCHFQFSPLCWKYFIVGPRNSTRSEGTSKLRVRQTEMIRRENLLQRKDFCFAVSSSLCATKHIVCNKTHCVQQNTAQCVYPQKKHLT